LNSTGINFSISSKIREISVIICFAFFTFMQLLWLQYTIYEVIYALHPNILDALGQWEIASAILLGKFWKSHIPVWCVCWSRLRKDSSVLTIASVSGKVTLPPFPFF
jgi:hypothetical protein